MATYKLHYTKCNDELMLTNFCTIYKLFWIQTELQIQYPPCHKRYIVRTRCWNSTGISKSKSW